MVVRAYGSGRAPPHSVSLTLPRPLPPRLSMSLPLPLPHCPWLCPRDPEWHIVYLSYQSSKSRTKEAGEGPGLHQDILWRLQRRLGPHGPPPAPPGATHSTSTPSVVPFVCPLGTMTEGQ